MINIKDIETTGYHLTASAIVICENKVLLLYHDKLKAWAQPGGHVEFGELPQFTCIREVFEETGTKVKHIDSTHQLDPEDIQFLIKPLTMQIVESVENRDRVFHLDFVYLCKPVNISPFTIDKAKVKWVEIANLKQYCLAKNVLELINLAISKLNQL